MTSCGGSYVSSSNWRDAAALVSQGWHQLAAEWCLKAFEQGYRGADLFAVLSSAYRGMGRLEDSLGASLASCLAKGATSDDLRALAHLCREAGLDREADACLRKAEAVGSGQSIPEGAQGGVPRASAAATIDEYLTRASRHLAQGERALALSVAADLEILAPQTGAADLIVGAVYERAGHYQEAAECYASAERFAPERAHAARLRAAAKDRAERVGRARPIVAQIKEQLAAGDDEGAARLASRLVGLVPWAPAPYLLWARVAERKGHAANALRHLREALARATEGREAIAAKTQALSSRQRKDPERREGQAS